MKTLFVFLLVFCAANITISQESYDENKYYGYLYEFYFARQPSARTEAMGRGVFANNENEFSSFYNPAQTSIGKGLDVNYSHSERYFNDNGINYNYIGASYNQKKIGSFGLSSYHMRSTGVTDETGREVEGRITYSLYTLNYAREIMKDFYAGVNLNILHTFIPSISTSTVKANDVFTADIGLYKKFQITTAASPYLTHSGQVAGSLFNVTGAKASFENIVYPLTTALPVTLRLGTSYNLELKKSQDSKMLNVFAHLSYENVLNSDTSRYAFYNSIKFGGEVTIMDIISLRAGYNSIFTETQFSDFKHQFTYGAGVKIPLNDILKIRNPFTLAIDYVYLKQPFPQEAFGDLGNFNTFNIRINYIPGL